MTIVELKEEIECLKREYSISGFPSGPTTECYGFNNTIMTEDIVGDWCGKEEEICDCFNRKITEILKMVDIHYIGSGIFYTTHRSGIFPKNWDKFQKEASDMIHEYITYDAFEDLCINPELFGFQEEK